MRFEHAFKLALPEVPRDAWSNSVQPQHHERAEGVIEQIPNWMAHYNHVHPHRALGYRSPREFIALNP